MKSVKKLKRKHRNDIWATPEGVIWFYHDSTPSTWTYMSPVFGRVPAPCVGSPGKGQGPYRRIRLRSGAKAGTDLLEAHNDDVWVGKHGITWIYSTAALGWYYLAHCANPGYRTLYSPVDPPRCYGPYRRIHKGER